MLLRGVVIRSRDYLASQFKTVTALRALSSTAEIVPKQKETTPVPKERRFVKPETARELKPFDPNFVINLFKGDCNKEIFEYPIIFEHDELETVVKHSLEVEDFLRNNPEIKVNANDVEQLKKLELFGLSIPQKYGGAGYSLTEAKFLIECCCVNPNLGRFLGYSDDVGSILISLYGTEEQKQKYLPKLASGESRITLAYLETGPLVDFSSFEGSVIVDYVNDGFLINAKKKWVHDAHVADLILVLVKASIIHEDSEDFSKLGFDFFITEKKSPGVSVHQLTSGCAKDFDLFEVDFKNVFVPKENKLGDNPVDGHIKLQSVLTYRQVTDAVMCSSLIKRLIHSALQFCETKIIDETPIKNTQHIQISLAYLSAYAYALESVIYLVTTRHDSHIEPNLFHEGILAKIFAVDMLQLAIQKYTQILGHDSFRKNDLLEQALKTLHFCSVFDENNIHLKLILGNAGLMNIKPSLITLVKKLRKRHEYPVETIKYKLSARPMKISKIDSKLGIKGDLNETLASKADSLEMCLGNIRKGLEAHLVASGRDSVQDEFTLVKFTEMVIYAYAFAAVLSRASTAYCYDFKNSETDIDIAKLVGDIITAKFEHLENEAIFLGRFSHFYKEIGKLCFSNKEYPAEHPLSRTY